MSGSCRVAVELVNGIGAVDMRWAEVWARGMNLVDYCVGGGRPAALGRGGAFGGVSVFGHVRVTVGESAVGGVGVA